jgi:membrane-associated protease RseP (regulator of RpoE activity)
MSLFAAVLVSSLGKVVNFLGRDFLVGINFLYCIFNLLPVSSLDGGRALYAALAWKFNENTAYKTEKILNISIVFLLLVAGVYAIFVYRNPTLFICSIVLLGSIN